MSGRDIGIVVIGRNEGPRLAACLRSLGPHIHSTVYVDSGSTDGSPEMAEGMGAIVERLDMMQPFTAARARNAGCARLAAAALGLGYIQFVDGDCELAEGWLDDARAFLDANRDVAIVAGRRRERRPEASVYNAMTDREWDVPAGEQQECGGDFLVRSEAFEAVGGFNPTLIAGEEPELCVRLRAAGWRIFRIASEMTRHDAAMTRFSQWWRRNVRGGHAFAEVARMHANSPHGIWKRSVSRACIWGGVIPATALATAAMHPAGLLLLGIYPLQVARMAMRQGAGQADNWAHATFLVLGKFPEMQGVASYEWNRLRGRRRQLIEYK